jgi:GTP-binding protein HflX
LAADEKVCFLTEFANTQKGDGIRRGVRAGVIVPLLAKASNTIGDDHSTVERIVRSGDIRLGEAVGLAMAIDLDVLHMQHFILKQPKAGTLLGSGKVAEIAEIIAGLDIEVLIVDHPLTPVQQRNLERDMKVKVLDRTGLILEIFGRRARTKEGVLQVELAHLNYQKGRLVRSWTHLERQRGGAGFLGGPGETQIETDRRLLMEKIDSLKRDLEKVRQTRTLHRAGRKKLPHPVVALVGYTNAGKSTLFNTLTGAEVLAEDMLFATLDPTLRKLKLPRGAPAIISDTVGFISELPTHLIAAFRATLEEVMEADLILHVRDVSNPDSQAQAADVKRILSELGLQIVGGTVPVIEVWNKIDQMDDSARDALLIAQKGATGTYPPFAVSALTGEGLPALLSAIEEVIAGSLERHNLLVGIHGQSALPEIYGSAHVAAREDREDGSVMLAVEANAQAIERLARLPGVRHE